MLNIYQTVTDRILKQLESGVVPWRKPWTSGLPKNLRTGKEYRGVNILMLASTDYGSRYWMTYKQARQLGGQVRKGERATPVIYWKWRTPEEIEKRRKKTGQQRIAPCVPFGSAVFNLEQVDGIDRPEDDRQPTEPLKTAAEVFDVMPDKPRIEHSALYKPCYIPSQDTVQLPHLSQFAGPHDYYGTLYHELCHATGSPKRLNRFQASQRDDFEAYSFEELVAEFGASFLAAFAGIRTPDTDEQQATYIAGWAKALKEDRQMIVKAATAAQRAADYVRGKVLVSQPEPITQEPRALATVS